MKIKITTSCSGYHFSFTQGETIEVEDYIGKDLIQCGFAEEVKTVKTSKRDTKPSVRNTENSDRDMKVEDESNAVDT